VTLAPPQRAAGLRVPPKEPQRGLAKTARRIGEVVGLINTEAARAGEAGRGFAVVASEVKIAGQSDRQGDRGYFGSAPMGEVGHAAGAAGYSNARTGTR
jgi:hypothetical protein